jgi:hypothetical protein
MKVKKELKSKSARETFNETFRDVAESIVATPMVSLVEHVARGEIDSDKPLSLYECQRDPAESPKGADRSYIVHCLYAIMAGTMSDEDVDQFEKDFDVKGYRVDVPTLPEFVCIAFNSKSGKRQYWIMDGGHRIVNYVYRFINGAFNIHREDHYAVDVYNDFVEWMFEKFAPDEEELSFDMLPKSIQQKFREMCVMVHLRYASNRKDCIEMFQAPNLGKTMTRQEYLKSTYGDRSAWKCLEALGSAAKLYASKNSAVFFTKSNPTYYNQKDWVILQNLLKIGHKEVYYTLPRIILSGGYIPEKYLKKLSWKQGMTMGDVLDVFFEATEKMSEKQVDNMIKKVFKNTLWLGKNIFISKDIESPNHQPISSMELMRNVKKYQHVMMMLLDNQRIEQLQSTNNEMAKAAASLFVNYIGGVEATKKIVNDEYIKSQNGVVEAFICNPEYFANTFQSIQRVRDANNKFDQLLSIM